jgi:hypothetical protein
MAVSRLLRLCKYRYVLYVVVGSPAVSENVTLL